MIECRTKGLEFDVSIDDHQILIAIAIQISKRSPPSDRGFIGLCNPCMDRCVLELQLAIAAIKRVEFVLIVRHPQVSESVEVVIPESDPHASFRSSAIVGRYSTLTRHFGELKITVIAVEQVRIDVIGNIEIYIPIGIQISSQDSESPQLILDPRDFVGVAKGSVADVFIEHIAKTLEFARATVIGTLIGFPRSSIDSTDRIVFETPIGIVSHIQIEQSIGIGIEECRRGPPMRIIESDRLRVDGLKRPIPLIPQQLSYGVSGDP